MSTVCAAALATTITAGAASTLAEPSVNKVYVDGEQANVAAYGINGNNYFKLRDLAAILSGTDAQFEVTWDRATGSITLTVAHDPANGDVLIELNDDGVGMTPEQAARALADPGPEDAKAKFRHVGLCNVHKRLQYSFGESYGLSIRSTPGQGTTVEVRLPGEPEQKGELT